MAPVIGPDRLVSIVLGPGVAGCTFPSPLSVRVEEGLEPRVTPAEVSALVIDHVHEMKLVAGRVEKRARILEMTATTGRGIGAIEPRAPAAPDA